MNTDDAKEVPDHFPKESPPPYSEVDPLKKSKERPNSLDLPSEQAEIQSEVLTENPPKDNNDEAQINEEIETTNEGIADVFKTSFLFNSRSICVLTLKVRVIFTPQILKGWQKTPFLVTNRKSLCHLAFLYFLPWLYSTFQSLSFFEEQGIAFNQYEAN